MQHPLHLLQSTAVHRQTPGHGFILDMASTSVPGRLTGSAVPRKLLGSLGNPAARTAMHAVRQLDKNSLRERWQGRWQRLHTADFLHSGLSLVTAQPRLGPHARRQRWLARALEQQHTSISTWWHAKSRCPSAARRSRRAEAEPVSWLTLRPRGQLVVRLKVLHAMCSAADPVGRSVGAQSGVLHTCKCMQNSEAPSNCRYLDGAYLAR